MRHYYHEVGRAEEDLMASRDDGFGGQISNDDGFGRPKIRNDGFYFSLGLDCGGPLAFFSHQLRVFLKSPLIITFH